NCSCRIKKTYENYLELAEKRFIKFLGHFKNDEFIPNEIPKNTTSNSYWECLTCEYKWSSSYSNIIRSKDCPQCAGILKHTYEDYIKLAEEKNMQYLGYSIKNDFIENEIPKSVICNSSKWKCNSCEYEWNNSYFYLKKRLGCPFCTNEIDKTFEDYLNI